MSNDTAPDDRSPGPMEQALLQRQRAVEQMSPEQEAHIVDALRTYVGIAGKLQGEALNSLKIEVSTLPLEKVHPGGDRLFIKFGTNDASQNKRVEKAIRDAIAVIDRTNSRKPVTGFNVQPYHSLIAATSIEALCEGLQNTINSPIRASIGQKYGIDASKFRSAGPSLG